MLLTAFSKTDNVDLQVKNCAGDSETRTEMDASHAEVRSFGAGFLLFPSADTFKEEVF